MRHKKIILIILIFGILRPTLGLTSPSDALEKNKTASIGETFFGEELNYTIGFWILSGVAVSKIKLEKTGRVYVATLSAHTTGIASWIRRREDTYVARLEEIEGGGRFRTLSFEENVVVGSKTRKVITILDYKKGIIKWKRWKKGMEKGGGELPIPKGIYYDDPLCAFYNLRFGAYGEIQEGKEFWIKSFPKKDNKQVDIHLRVANGGEFAKRVNGNPIARYLADVKLDKELFDSTSGDMEILFNSSLVPVKGIAKDVMYFGDITGELVSDSVILSSN